MGGSYDDVGSDEDTFAGDDLDLGETTHEMVHVILSNSYIISARLPVDSPVLATTQEPREDFVKSQVLFLLKN